MKKRNIGISRILVKLMGTTLATFLFFSLNVHAEEVEELDNSEDIATISDGIDTLDEKVDTLNDNCQDEELSEDISDISYVIDVLNETISKLSRNYAKLSSTIDNNRRSIIDGLNRTVFSNNNISKSASYSDVISKINGIKNHGTLDVTLDGNDKFTLESGYYEGGTIDVSAIVEAVREEAYNAGKADGYKEGKEEGLKEGLTEGIKSGRDEGVKAGKEEGFNAGKEEGIKEGFESGKEEGFKAGKEEGFNAGKEEGIKEGFESGKEEGFKTGREEGVNVGKEYMMTNTENWISTGRSSSLSISPYITYKSYKYFYIKNTVTNGLPLNSNDVVRLWIKTSEGAWGRMMVDIPITSGTNVGGGWYQYGVSEGISMVELINNNNVPRDYVYRFSN